MAAAVAATIESGGTLLAEAGTGTGKTLAYLIPAILSRQRVLVSTGTKNLQEQIFFETCPCCGGAQRAVHRHADGAFNYLCLHRWETCRDESRPTSVGGRLIESGDRVLPVIEEWATETQTGDRAELRDLPEDLPLWKEIAAEADTCLGTECPRYGECFLTLMRQRAAESDVVIVNHHLLCADASVRQGAFGEVIPSCSTLVVDEAHQLEDVATQYFGVSFSNFRVDDLVRDGDRVLGAAGFDARLTEEVARALRHVGDHARVFFSALALARVANPGASDVRARYTAEAMTEYGEDGLMLAGALEGLEASLALAQVGDPGSGIRGHESTDPRSPIPVLRPGHRDHSATRRRTPERSPVPPACERRGFRLLPRKPGPRHVPSSLAG
jgi:ATP-dependent DNA helicase DinG